MNEYATMHVSMELTDVLMETFALSLMLPLLSYYTECQTHS